MISNRRLKYILMSIIACLIILNIFIYLPTTAHAIQRGLVNRMDPYTTMDDEQIHNSLVFITSVPNFNPEFYTRNSLGLDDDNLFVLDRGCENVELLGLFPDRNCYIYDYKAGIAKLTKCDLEYYKSLCKDNS